MKIKRLVVGEFQSNCYLIFNNNKEVIIIDPGDDAEYIISEIYKNNLNPVFIIATHGHFDHILAAFELQNAFNIPFIIHEEDLFLVINMRKSAKYFLGLESDPPPAVMDFLYDGQNIKIGDILLSIIHTPGHTPGSICIFEKSLNAIFVGDLLFAGNFLGRTDHKYSSKVNLLKSLKRIKAKYKGCTVYPGHGAKTFI
jgi:hydroxyacylglutathione hydrolase